MPVDLEHRDDVRTLARVFRAHMDSDDATQCATLCVVRLWLDWARVGADWRALQQARSESRDWGAENLTHLISEFCRWSGSPAALISCLIEAGVLAVVARGELDGFVLADFAEFNGHLLPGHESIQAKGGRAKAEKRRAEELQLLAAQQAKVLEQQGLALFAPSDNVSEEERQKCVAMVMGLDGVCGLPVRLSKEYVDDKALMRDALAVLRGNAWDDVVLVQRYVRGQRDNPEVVKETGAILRGFYVYLRKANE